MKTILLLAQCENERTRWLQPILETEFRVSCLNDSAEAIRALEAREEMPRALILDAPSRMEGVEALIDFVRKGNSNLFGIPILALTDETCRDRDELYLDDTVLATLEPGQSPRVVLQRINKANDSINSVSFQEFSRMLKVLPSLIYLKDAKGRYVFCSQYLHHLEHYDDPNWSIRGKTDLEIRRDQANARLAYESDLRMIATGQGTSYVIEENEDGVREFLQLIKEPLKNEDGQVRGIIAIINNVTEQEELRRELKRKSITDELTGLYNRTYFEEYVTTLEEGDYPLGILSADCDGLKTINDRYGHAMGDEYIRMTATLLKTTLPEKSVICRIGGDEFLVLLSNADEAVLEGLMRAVAEAQAIFSIQGRPLSVSLGAGLARTPGDLIQGIDQSDRAMYRNKRAKKQKEAP